MPLFLRPPPTHILREPEAVSPIPTRRSCFRDGGKKPAPQSVIVSPAGVGRLDGAPGVVGDFRSEALRELLLLGWILEGSFRCRAIWSLSLWLTVWVFQVSRLASNNIPLYSPVVVRKFG